MFTIYIIYTKQQAARPEREKTMDVNSTISALNKITADVKQLSDSMSSATDPEEITPQLIGTGITHSYMGRRRPVYSCNGGPTL